MLITLTGPTGSGKSTLAQALIEKGVTLVPTYTTRPLRPDEIGRGDMVHVSHEEMRNCEMLETAQYDGHWYGTPVTTDVKAALAGNGVSLKILEPQGLATLQASLKATQDSQDGTHHHVAHVYVSVDAGTAYRRLMARCGGKPAPADFRRLDRATAECNTWPALSQWSHVIDNNVDGASMQGHAAVLLASLDLSAYTAPAHSPDYDSPRL